MKNNIEKTKKYKMFMVDVIGMVILFSIIQFVLLNEPIKNKDLTKADTAFNQSCSVMTDSTAGVKNFSAFSK